MSQSNEEQLYDAAFDGDLEEVTLLCSDPAINVNWQDEGGFTPLSSACQEGHPAVAEYLLSLKGIDPNKPINDGATPFCIACQQGHKEVVSLLLADPRIDPNKQANDGATPFLITCGKRHKEVVSLLLADPRFDPNKAKNERTTPFFIACQDGHKEVVSLLLADPTIDPNKPDNNQSTPLWYASQNGHLVVVEHLLASGREIDTRKRSTFNNRTAAEQGRAMGTANKGDDETEEAYERSKTNGPLCANVIDEYERNPVAVRHRLRRQPGLRESFIAGLFALVVFHSESFVVINERLAHPDTKRFFRICARLPLEVQMIICNRAFGSPKDIILSRDSEPCFQLLDRSTTWQYGFPSLKLKMRQKILSHVASILRNHVIFSHVTSIFPPLFLTSAGTS